MKTRLFGGMLLALPIFASAYTQTMNFNTATSTVSTLQTFEYTHDLTTSGFNPSLDDILDYHLTLQLYNKSGILDVVYVNQPGMSADAAALFYNWSYASIATGDSYQGLASLNANGLLTVKVTSLLGTFSVMSSTLDATGNLENTDSHPVPEPASLALLGAGLLGMAIMRRKQLA